MSSIGTNLLFLHGHIHDPELVRRLANVPVAPRPRRQRDTSRSTPEKEIPGSACKKPQAAPE